MCRVLGAASPESFSNSGNGAKCRVGIIRRKVHEIPYHPMVQSVGEV